ncbi:MAG: phosphoenolpyruvate--protein phosphotransferase [Desulfuromonadales bacterium]
MTASENSNIPGDTFLIGIGVSPGIAIGEAYLVNRVRMAAVERPIAPEEVAGEKDNFLKAVQISRRQLEEVKAGVSDQQFAEHLYIIDTHLLILEDEMLIGETCALIENEQVNAEGALKRVLRKFRRIFDSIEDEYLRERRSDVDSVGDRLLRNLMGEAQQSLSEVELPSIIVAHDFSPADTMQMDKAKILGFLTDVGGRTSHSAILSRSLGIPAVVGLETISSMVPGGTPLIIDGATGTVIIKPSDETIREYRLRKQSYEYQEKELLSYCNLRAETRDGYHLALRSNVEVASEALQVNQYGGEGIGLFRTEFLFMNRLTPPSEEEQFQIYKDIVESVAPHPVTIRTLDVGGDKFVAEINLADEANPAMGLRGIRFSLKEGRLLKVQLRAILRASAFGRVRIMFPLISGVAEVRACRQYLAEAQGELQAEGAAFDSQVAIGIMIETPAATLIADSLAKEVDFFSVGTNDLIQYCLAVDRGNEHVAYLYDPLHPAILKALRMICEAARNGRIAVGICGEMASEPLYALVLLGLGFHELSMNAPAIPRVKRILRQGQLSDGEALVARLLQFSTASEITQCLEEEMGRRFPDLFPAPSF